MPDFILGLLGVAFTVAGVWLLFGVGWALLTAGGFCLLADWSTR